MYGFLGTTGVSYCKTHDRHLRGTVVPGTLISKLLFNPTDCTLVVITRVKGPPTEVRLISATFTDVSQLLSHLYQNSEGWSPSIMTSEASEYNRQLQFRTPS